MPLLDKLERRFGRFAIPKLTLWIVLGQGLGLLLGYTEGAGGGGPIQAGEIPGPLADWWLVGDKVVAGEWWRLATFMLRPPGFSILVLFCLYLFYIMGTALEQQWGAFRFNIYLLIGYLATVGSAFLVPSRPAASGYIAGSVLLAFAWLHPDFRLLLMFVIPVKIKFFAWLTWAIFAATLAWADWIDKLLAVVAVLNFLLFFGRDILLKVRSGHRRLQQDAEKLDPEPFHRCAVCGVTEQDDPQMMFRFCSKCTGQHEYCEVHLGEHEHVEQQPAAG